MKHPHVETYLSNETLFIYSLLIKKMSVIILIIRVILTKLGIQVQVLTHKVFLYSYMTLNVDGSTCKFHPSFLEFTVKSSVRMKIFVRLGLTI